MLGNPSVFVNLNPVLSNRAAVPASEGNPFAFLRLPLIMLAESTSSVNHPQG